MYYKRYVFHVQCYRPCRIRDLYSGKLNDLQSLRLDRHFPLRFWSYDVTSRGGGPGSLNYRNAIWRSQLVTFSRCCNSTVVVMFCRWVEVGYIDSYQESNLRFEIKSKQPAKIQKFYWDLNIYQSGLPSIHV